MPADGSDKRVDEETHVDRVTAKDLIIDRGVTFCSDNCGIEIILETMAKLPAVKGSRVILIEIFTQRVCVDGQEYTDPAVGVWCAHRYCFTRIGSINTNQCEFNYTNVA